MSFESTAVNVIKLTLLHPSRSIPVRTWTFDHESIIRIGRSIRNHVVLYSAVVSRCHVELRQVGQSWKVINLGTNGTYVNGMPIIEAFVEDGQVIHLAVSGPKIQLNIDVGQLQPQSGSVNPNLKQEQVQVLESTDIQTEVRTLITPNPVEIPLPQSNDEITEVDRQDQA